MKVLIIEDEGPAARRLSRMILELRPNFEITGTCSGVAASLEWLKNNPSPDLIFMDIHLSDGLSFEIFQQTSVTSPVVFTTAYDQYMLKAFKVNSIDYLLKPVDSEELKNAIEKFEKLTQNEGVLNEMLLKQLLSGIKAPEYRERFLVKMGDELVQVPVSDVLAFSTEDGLTLLHTGAKKRFPLDQSLDQLTPQLDPTKFFRVSRSVILNIDSIGKISQHFNGRLKVKTQIDLGEDIYVSRSRVQDFKSWLDR